MSSSGDAAKCVAVVQARMFSNNAKSKPLLEVGGMPLLQCVLQNVHALRQVKEIVLAITQEPADDAFEQLPFVQAMLAQGKLRIFKGASLDVVRRLTDAVAAYEDQDCLLRFSVNHPFVHTSVTESIIKSHLDAGADYTAVDGLSFLCPEVFRVGALRVLNGMKDLSDFEREKVAVHFWNKNANFRSSILPKNFGGLDPSLEQYLFGTFQAKSDVDRLSEIVANCVRAELPSDCPYLPGTDMFPSVEAILEFAKKQLSDFRSATATTPSVMPGGTAVYSASTANSSKEVRMAGVPVGPGYPCYIAAEIGQNHNGDINLAKKLIDMSVRCGVNAVKFQKRDIPSELTKEAYDRPYDNPNSFGRTYGEHRIALELNPEEHRELAIYAKSQGTVYFCTPCDIPSVDVLEDIGVPFYKVASRDLTNLPLLSYLGSKGKPVILSTGMASEDDIQNGLDAIGNGVKCPIILLQCTSSYPCTPENVNLACMKTLADKFGFVTGFSDHTKGVVCPLAAAVMGASIIEKHVTLDRSMKGTDQPGSLEEKDLLEMVQNIRMAEKAVGDGIKCVNPATAAAMHKLARSVTSKREIQKGEVIQESMLCLKSPGDGYKWVDRVRFVGKVAAQLIPSDATLRDNMILAEPEGKSGKKGDGEPQGATDSVSVGA